MYGERLSDVLGDIFYIWDTSFRQFWVGVVYREYWLLSGLDTSEQYVWKHFRSHLWKGDSPILDIRLGVAILLGKLF